jgi:tRNA/rRNA methyltransferase
MLGPIILLHSPQLGENIGAAARIMLNFGLTDLRLVTPRDGWPNPAATPMSAGAFDAGVTVESHESLESAIEDVTYLIAATARMRGIEKEIVDAPGAAKVSSERLVAGQGRPAIMFGAEKSGLPNDAVALCDLIMTYPVNDAFSSLNLAQAVSVFAAEWGKLAQGVATRATPGGLGDPAPRAELIRMFEHFEDELERAGYFYPPAKTPLMKDNLRAAFVRADWTHQEIQTFRGAIKALAIGRGKARTLRDDT